MSVNNNVTAPDGTTTQACTTQTNPGGELAPRLAFFIFWTMRPVQVDAAFSTWIFPLLGLFFLPLATLLHAVLWTVGGLTGWAWFWVVLAALIDLAHMGSAAASKQYETGPPVGT